jgi:dihydrofolate synthase / folylpolyglutamate synthase
MESGFIAPPGEEAGKAEEIERIAAGYPGQGRRESLSSAERLQGALPAHGHPTAVAVVGTNGKSSTATYLARLLGALGMRAGLYVSPHIAGWSERVRVDDVPQDPLPVLTEVDRIAKQMGKMPDLRFFDALTLAAELIFARRGCDVAVYEAGIGGRLDAVRLLRPSLVVLTSVGLDHVEILGPDRAAVLKEKLLVAPPGAVVVSFRLGRELDRIAEGVARESGFTLRWVADERIERVRATARLPRYLRAALALALECAALLDPGNPVATEGALPKIDLSLPGRFERGEREGVPYLLDVAHNEPAWRELAAELRRQPIVPSTSAPLSVLFSVSLGKQRDGLAAALREVPGLARVFVTRHLARPADRPRGVVEDLRRGGIEAAAVEDPAVATKLAFDSARSESGAVLVVGSTYLVATVKELLEGGGAQE